MTRWADAVAVVRAAVTTATAAPTAVVLSADFARGPMPLVHVHLDRSEVGDLDRVDTVGVDVYAITPTDPADEGAAALAARLVDALVDARPVETSAGWADAVDITQQLGARPYWEEIEVASLTLDVVHRPLD